MFDSLRFFIDNYADVRHIQERRTNANVIRDAMKHRALELAASQPHTFRTTELNGLFLLIVRDKYGVRLKQLDEDLQPNNNETAQSVAFQTQQLDIPDLGTELISINLGYVADWTELLSSRIVMVCPDGIRRLREWELGVSKVIPLPLPDAEKDIPSSASDGHSKPQVRPKEDETQHSQPEES